MAVAMIFKVPPISLLLSSALLHCSLARFTVGQSEIVPKAVEIFMKDPENDGKVEASLHALLQQLTGRRERRRRAWTPTVRVNEKEKTLTLA